LGKIIKKVINIYTKYKKIIDYLIFGVLTTVVNYITYLVCTRILDLSVTLSTLIAWVISVLFAYITNKIYVFESKTNTVKTFIKEILMFFAFRLLSGIMDIVIMYVSVEILSINDIVMKLVSNIVVIIVNYIFSKCFVFKNN